MKTKILACYNAPSDDGEYEFDATWHESAEGLTWKASVRVKRPTACEIHPTGIIPVTNVPIAEALVRSAVASATERYLAGGERRAAAPVCATPMAPAFAPESRESFVRRDLGCFGPMSDVRPVVTRERRTQWHFHYTPANTWSWEAVCPMGQEVRSAGEMSSLADCIADATANGYAPRPGGRERREARSRGDALLSA
jgi:hypothetical protein